MPVSRFDEVWAVKAERISDYFNSVEGIRRNADGSYRLLETEITLQSLPDRQLGSLFFPQTRVVITGSSRFTEEIHHQFTLQFLSGGA